MGGGGHLSSRCKIQETEAQRASREEQDPPSSEGREGGGLREQSKGNHMQHSASPQRGCQRWTLVTQVMGGSGQRRHTSHRTKRRLQLKSASQTPAGPREGSHGHEWRTGSQCRGGGELQREPRAARSLTRLEASLLINWRRRVQGTGPSA